MLYAVQALSDVVRVVAGEDLIVHILRALQALATVAGILSLPDVTLATVSAVCEFTSIFAPAGDEVLAEAPSSSGLGDAGQDTGVGEGTGADRTESTMLGSAASGAVEAVFGERKGLVGDKSFTAMDRVGVMARPAMLCAAMLP